uniref:Uncharacterized protein n=1 Tax=Sander lucioperca TaxID=283035 RepID=A0A8D0CZA1_SANLU
MYLSIILIIFVSCVCSTGIFFTEPVICYYLDGILILYCIFATVLFFREKVFSLMPPIVYSLSEPFFHRSLLVSLNGSSLTQVIGH